VDRNQVPGTSLTLRLYEKNWTREKRKPSRWPKNFMLRCSFRRSRLWKLQRAKKESSVFVCLRSSSFPKNHGFSPKTQALHGHLAEIDEQETYPDTGRVPRVQMRRSGRKSTSQAFIKNWMRTPCVGARWHKLARNGAKYIVSRPHLYGIPK